MSHGKISVFFEMTEKTGHTLCYDGDCPFCRSMVNRWRGTLERRGFEIVPLQTEWVRRRLDLPEEELLSELRVLTPDGRVLGHAQVKFLGHFFLDDLHGDGVPAFLLQNLAQ